MSCLSMGGQQPLGGPYDLHAGRLSQLRKPVRARRWSLRWSTAGCARRCPRRRRCRRRRCGSTMRTWRSCAAAGRPTQRSARALMQSSRTCGAAPRLAALALPAAPGYLCPATRGIRRRARARTCIRKLNARILMRACRLVRAVLRARSDVASLCQRGCAPRGAAGLRSAAISDAHVGWGGLPACVLAGRALRAALRRGAGACRAIVDAEAQAQEQARRCSGCA